MVELLLEHGADINAKNANPARGGMAGCFWREVRT